MKIVKTQAHTLCDNGACRHMAEYLVSREDTPLANSLNICSSCVKELYALFGGIVRPKVVGNIIKKAQLNSQPLRRKDEKQD